MPILESEIVYYRSAVVNDTTANGGRRGSQTIACGVKGNLFPDISQAQRVTGLTRYRKIFARVENADDLALLGAYVHLTRNSVGDDWVVLFGGGQRGTQGDIASPRLYTAAKLKTAVSAGATSFQLTLAHADLSACFVDEDTVCISDGTNTEYFTGVDVEVSGVTVTITLAGSDQLANSYTTAATWGASVMSAGGDIEPTVSDWDDSDTAAGTYDDATYPVELGNLGTVEDDWTLTFTSATNFTVSGTFTGSLGSGSINSDFAPNNPGGGKYFTLRAAGWGGVWAAGDTVTWSTHPAALPIWLRQTVPAGAAAAAASDVAWFVGGETA